MKRHNDKKWRQKGKTAKFFPIQQHRFITDKHPCVLASGKKGRKFRLTLTLNEKRMLEGLTNMFSSIENQAIRIALWEMYEQLKEQPGCLGEARANPKTTRSNTKTLTIPHIEVERFRQFGVYGRRLTQRSSAQQSSMSHEPSVMASSRNSQPAVSGHRTSLRLSGVRHNLKAGKAQSRLLETPDKRRGMRHR